MASKYRRSSKLLQKTVLRPHRRYGWYPRYDPFYLRALDDAGWATPDELRADVASHRWGVPLRWFQPNGAHVEEWLRTAELRRLVDRASGGDLSGRWGTSERGMSRLPRLPLGWVLPVVGPIIGAGSFAASQLEVDPVLVVLIAALIIGLGIQLVVYAFNWRSLNVALTMIAWELELANQAPAIQLSLPPAEPVKAVSSGESLSEHGSLSNGGRAPSPETHTA